MTDIGSGWRRDLEDSAVLRILQSASVPKDFITFANPAEVRPDIGPNQHKLENQSSMGSCQGHGIASCVEQLNTLLQPVETEPN